jgi:hypothetical protein
MLVPQPPDETQEEMGGGGTKRTPKVTQMAEWSSLNADRLSPLSALSDRVSAL